jgi:uncharacterized FAD-dependent dehydrogenase
MQQKIYLFSLVWSLTDGYTFSPLQRRPKWINTYKNDAGRRPLVVIPQSSKKRFFDPVESTHRQNRNNNKTGRSKPQRQQQRVKNIINQSILSTWRVFGINVHPDALVTDDEFQETDKDGQAYSNNTDNSLHPAVRHALEKRMGQNNGQIKDTKIVRRSLDARKKNDAPQYVYTIDVTVDGPSMWKHQAGRLERIVDTTTATKAATTTSLVVQQENQKAVRPSMDHVAGNNDIDNATMTSPLQKTVVIVGAGPAGLFCALELLLAQQQQQQQQQTNGTKPEGRMAMMKLIVLERGQPVETRGRDIGGLIHRRTLNRESNFCFGEGGAGTWSDGKLTTRIGRNSRRVRRVLETLVQYGAPPRILMDGAPHLGTDALVRLLRNLRADLQRMGGEIRFGCKAKDILWNDNNDGNDHHKRVVKGVVYESSSMMNPNGTSLSEEEHMIECDALVFATGHSARDTYENLHSAGIPLEPKGFAVGFRVEHPQRLINEMQYGREWGPSVVTGKRLTDRANQQHFATTTTTTNRDSNNVRDETSHRGRLPVPSYRLATNKVYDGDTVRGVYSFCMCPGGQIVPGKRYWCDLDSFSSSHNSFIHSLDRSQRNVCQRDEF